MTSQSKLAVVIPFSNRPLEPLERVLDSISGELEPDDLLVVSKQMRMPACDHALLELCRPHRAIVVLSRSPDFNVSRARNSGAFFAMLNGVELVQFLDADVLLPPGYLGRARALFEDKPAMVHPRVTRSDGTHSGLGLGCPMVRVAEWHAVRGYDESWLEAGEDGDFLLRISNQFGVMATVLEYQEAVHLDHPGPPRGDGSERKRRRFELKLPEEQEVNPHANWGTYVVVTRT
jgi:glycosyltransferase involved in cell wall biosynthesis